jgi:hypothetical protein
LIEGGEFSGFLQNTLEERTVHPGLAKSGSSRYWLMRHQLCPRLGPPVLQKYCRLQL